MKRVRSEFDDSLELLLDTICNVFGGIVFIAMLVALLTNAKADSRPNALQPAEETVTATTLMEAEQAYERIRQAAETVNLNIEIFDDDGAEESLDHVDAIESKIADANQQSERLVQWLAEFDDLTIGQDALLEERHALAAAKLKQLEAEVKDVEEKQTQELRLPIARQTGKMQVILVIKAGRIHVVPTGGSAGLLRAFEGDVTLRSFGNMRRVTPNAEGGCPGDENLESSAWFIRLMQTIDPRRQHLDMAIYPDSIDAFQAIRAAALKRGYQYGVTPMGAGEALELQPTNQPRTVQ